MNRLQIARSLHDYDPDATPQFELERAEKWVESTKRKLTNITEQVHSVEDNSVYRAYRCRSGEYYIQQRQVEKITPKQVSLAEAVWERARRLPRQELEAGEVWRDGESYYFGRNLRVKLRDQMFTDDDNACEAQANLDHIRHQIATGDVVLGESLLEEIDRVVEGLQRNPAKVNWIKEGF